MNKYGYQFRWLTAKLLHIMTLIICAISLENSLIVPMKASYPVKYAKCGKIYQQTDIFAQADSVALSELKWKHRELNSNVNVDQSINVLPPLALLVPFLLWQALCEISKKYYFQIWHFDRTFTLFECCNTILHLAYSVLIVWQ